MGDFVRKSGGFLKGYFFWTLQFFRNDFFSFVAYVHFLPVLHTYLRFFFLAKYFLIQLHREIKRDLFFKQQQIKRKNFCFVFVFFVAFRFFFMGVAEKGGNFFSIFFQR